MNKKRSSLQEEEPLRTPITKYRSQPSLKPFFQNRPSIKPNSRKLSEVKHLAGSEMHPNTRNRITSPQTKQDEVYSKLFPKTVNFLRSQSPRSINKINSNHLSPLTQVVNTKMDTKLRKWDFKHD